MWNDGRYFIGNDDVIQNPLLAIGRAPAG